MVLDWLIIISQYLDNAHVANSLQKLRNKSLECTVASMWCGILAHSFPVSEGFVVTPEQKLGSGYADLVLENTQLVEATGKYINLKVFVLEMKRPSGEGSDKIWADAMAQLVEYMKGVRVDKKKQTRRFAAIGVGKYVRLYEWNFATQEGLQMHKEDYLHVEKEVKIVQEKLEYVRNNYL